MKGTRLKTISILGSGWLGLPLARHFIKSGYTINASTTSENRKEALAEIDAAPFVIDTESPGGDIKKFLQADSLIINIPSKNLASFQRLASDIKDSSIKTVLFVSSTSIYVDVNRRLDETDKEYFSQSPLLEIESLLMHLQGVKTTIIRFGGLIGYSRHPGRFFRPGTVIQNPDAPVNLIHRDDCIGIIDRVFEKQLWGEVLNCCADTHPAKRDFYTRAIKSLGGALPAFGESNPESGKIISNQKTRRLLNYEFKHPDLMAIEFEEDV